MKTILAVAVAVSACALAGQSARASTIYELGLVNPGHPASANDETGYLTSIISGFNAGQTGDLGGSPDLSLSPGSFVAGFSKLPSTTIVNSGQQGGGGGALHSGFLSVNVTGYEYALVKCGDEDEVYYFGGVTGTINLFNDTGESPLNQESHFDLFTATGTSITGNGGVPDGLGVRP